jgi:hypothetical protein
MSGDVAPFHPSNDRKMHHKGTKVAKIQTELMVAACFLCFLVLLRGEFDAVSTQTRPPRGAMFSAGHDRTQPRRSRLYPPIALG